MQRQPQLFEEYMDDIEFRAEMKLAEIAMELAEVIEQLRIDRSLTQAQLAELINTKQSQVSRMENAATARFTLKSLAKLSDALGCNLEVKLVNKPEEVVVQPVMGYQSGFDGSYSALEKQCNYLSADSANAANNVIDFTAKRQNARSVCAKEALSA